MKTTDLTFNFSDTLQIRAFAQLVRELNETGVPFVTEQDSSANLTVTITISDGY